VDNEQGWRRLADAVRQRRDERGWTQPDVYSRGGPSIDRIQAIEGVRTDSYSSRTLSKLERALEWEAGSCRAILAGGEPTPIDARRVTLSDRGAAAETLDTAPSLAELTERLERQEQTTARLAEQNENLRRMLHEITGKDPQSAGNAGGEEPESDEPRQAM
jgi:hypothetical protein